MSDVPEARERNGKIYLNGWTRWLVGALWGLLMTGLVMLTQNVIANDQKYIKSMEMNTREIHNNSRQISMLSVQYDSIKEDLAEIKTILRRTAPYERK